MKKYLLFQVVFLLFLTNAQAQWTSTHNGSWWTQTEITLDSLITDYWNGTIEIAGDTSDYTLAQMDKVFKNATISRYDISNPAVADTFMIFWADDSLEVDSIQVYADDSTTIQIKMDGTNMLSSAYLIDDGVSSTITSINEGTLYTTKKARLYFTALGDNVKKVHLKIYWRYL